jgi:ketosteroid isomerase-like protein
MSQENVEIVRSFYGAWARDEFPGPVELMDPEIEYVNPAGAVEPGIQRGLAAFSRAVDKLFEGWETWEMEPEQFRAVGDQVAVVVRYRARGRGSGVEVEGRESALWTLRDGKVAQYDWFHEPAEALEAAGACGVGDVAGSWSRIAHATSSIDPFGSTWTTKGISCGE